MRAKLEKFITWKLQRIILREIQPVLIYYLFISPAAWVSRKSFEGERVVKTVKVTEETP